MTTYRHAAHLYRCSSYLCRHGTLFVILVDMQGIYHDIKFHVDMGLCWRYSTYLGWHTAYRLMSTCKILLVNADIQYINVDINLIHIGMQLNVHIDTQLAYARNNQHESMHGNILSIRFSYLACWFFCFDCAGFSFPPSHCCVST